MKLGLLVAGDTNQAAVISPWFRGGYAGQKGEKARQGLSPDVPAAERRPTPSHPIRRADGAEHRHRAAAGRHHSIAHRGGSRRQCPRQGDLLQPQVPARRLLLWWVPSAEPGLAGRVQERAEGRAAPPPSTQTVSALRGAAGLTSWWLGGW